MREIPGQLFPELDLIGSYGWSGTSREFSGTFGQFDQGNQPFYSYGAQMTVPLTQQAARNTFKASKVQQAQLLLQLKQLEQNVMVGIDNSVKNAEAAWERAFEEPWGEAPHTLSIDWRAPRQSPGSCRDRFVPQ